MDYRYNLQIIGIIRGFMLKNQFQTKTLSVFCEDPRGAHQFFFKSADYYVIHGLWYNLQIIAIICGLCNNPRIIGQNVI